MEQQRIIFESSPVFIILCVLLALGYSLLLYKAKYPWSKTLNNVLFAARAILAFLLAFMLLGPIVRQINNLLEKPLYVVLHDNSGSVQEVSDSLTLRNLGSEILNTKEVLEAKGYDVSINDLEGTPIAERVLYDASASDINGAIRKIANLYEGKNLSGVILVSDGIYNSGLSPLYANYNFPIHTLGVGDTTQRIDLTIKNIAFNKIAYEGNRFPVRVEVLAKGLENQDVTVSLLQRGSVLERQTKNSGKDALMTFDFQPLANEQGIQKLDIQIAVKPEEFNTRNNRSSIFVEVVEGKKKILVVAPSPHPDIKAIRSVVDLNANYEFLLHIPGITEQQPADLQPGKIDLAIFHQSPDLRGRTRELFQTFAKSKTSVMLIVGRQSDLTMIMRQNMPLKFESLPRDFDEVTPVINQAFSQFTLSAEAPTQISGYPPVSVHFGRIQLSLGSIPILYQRVGTVTTDKPLLVINNQDNRKVGIMLGEGLWLWRLDEFDRTEKSEIFDELFGKLIQYLSTVEDKRKFRSYPIQQEFSDAEPVIFESQVFNDIFEPVYGNTIKLEIADERGKVNNYSYVTNAGNTRYQIGGLDEGVFKYKAQTVIDGKTEEVRGQFAVVKKLSELQNLTADFDLLRKLSQHTGGKFYPSSNITNLQEDLQLVEAKGVLHSEETYDSLINLKWIFWLLLFIVAGEWFLRKYHGSY